MPDYLQMGYGKIVKLLEFWVLYESITSDCMCHGKRLLQFEYILRFFFFQCLELAMLTSLDLLTEKDCILQSTK